MCDATFCDDDYTLDDARDDAAITSWEIRHDLGEA